MPADIAVVALGCEEVFMRWFRLLLLWMVAFTVRHSVLGADTVQAYPRQFIVVNLAPGEIKREVFGEIAKLQPDSSSSSVTLGVGTIFSYLHQPRSEMEALLRRFLRLSKEFNMPIVVQWDGEQWWGARSDLWNWWDPKQAGYSPENRWNVEWTDWGPEHAVRIGWRNWGRQIRVLPAPNLMSPRYREACREEMQYLLPIVLKWWKSLPSDKKDLLIGMKMGWESSIGMSPFYYPNGNALADLPKEKDPTTGRDVDVLPGRGVAVLGYAAVSTVGIAEKGPLLEEHLTEVIWRHLRDLCKLAAEMGVPRDRLFTHAGGWKSAELLYDAAVNQYSCPGWSFYEYSTDPSKDAGVRRALKYSDAPYWAAVEWLDQESKTEQDWLKSFTATLASPKCRYLCIYNWRGIQDKKEALAAIQSILRDGVRR